MLRAEGKIPAPIPPKRTEADKLVDDFGHYLATERGFVATTVAGYCRAVRLFLGKCIGSEVIDLEKIDAPLLINFTRQYARKHIPITSQSMLVGLRSFLRYLWHRKRVETDLSSSVPRIALWSLAGLPRHLPAGAVEKVITEGSDATAIGGRNHAIVLVLARLGLRACEVADLRLQDFDWQRGLVRVRSRKGARWATMPLPADVGKAVATYLAKGRPQCSSRHVFIRIGAPLGGMTRMGIGSVARTAMIRAGMTGARLGPHTFRHTLATDLLRRGATLHDIGEVLRHRDASTTAIYAKVDLPTLQSLAVAWPGGAS
jgi:site-specific recombinase XerD